MQSTDNEKVVNIDPAFSLARKIVNSPHFEKAQKELKSAEIQRFLKSQKFRAESYFKWHVYDDYADNMIKDNFLEQFK